MNSFNANKIQVGISACLIGHKVRFDGGHKISFFCNEQLSQFVEYQPICPEMSIGMGTPRRTIRLLSDEERIRVVASDGSFDVTDKLERYAKETVDTLEHLSGYIVCAKSPTCGMERVSVYKSNPRGHFDVDKIGVGVFTRELMRRFPNLPIEENGRLNDTHIREAFVTQLLAYHDFKMIQHAGVTRGALVDFHSRYKYLLMAHNPIVYKKLGRLVANPGDLVEASEAYLSALMQSLRKPCSRKNHANVLQHLQGYFKRALNPVQKQNLTTHIDKYRRGLLPLMVPITLIQQYLTEYPNDYLQKQVYLNPHPEELRLRYDH